MSSINADANTDAMSEALKDAADDLEGIAGENTQIVEEFEQQGWSGLDALEQAQSQIGDIRDNLTEVADKIGVGGQIVRDAHANNPMITRASKASLAHQ